MISIKLTTNITDITDSFGSIQTVSPVPAVSTQNNRNNEENANNDNESHGKDSNSIKCTKKDCEIMRVEYENLKKEHYLVKI